MELQSSKETFLKFQHLMDGTDTFQSIENINSLMYALLNIAERIDNITTMTVTIEMGISEPITGYDDHEPDAVSDDGDYADNSAIWPDPPTAVVIDGNQYRIGDEITVINPEARIGNTNLQYRTGKIAKLPNHNTEMFMVQFDGISADVAMRRDEFRVYLPF